MSRITKEIATEVALKLTATKKEAWLKKENELQSMLYEIIKSKIPKDVLETYEKHKGYFQTRNSFQLNGNGFNFQSLTIKKELPYLKYTFEPSVEEGKKLIVLKDKVGDLKTEYKDLVRDIENLLYNLRTYTKVISEFPEAEQFLPNKITDKLSLNVSDIKKRLK